MTLKQNREISNFLKDILRANKRQSDNLWISNPVFIFNSREESELIQIIADLEKKIYDMEKVF